MKFWDKYGEDFGSFVILCNAMVTAITMAPKAYCSVLAKKKNA
jgi:hypothetical protein